jgi:RNA polymerase sigma-70 factor (ECF subfamily)
MTKPSGSTQERRSDFESLYERYHREVWALAFARWMDTESALDIMHETFLRLWRMMLDNEIIENPRAWLLRVARNLAEDYAKSAFRKFGTQPPELMGSLTARGMSPVDGMIQEEKFAEIRKLLDELAPADREILTLRYALDYDSPEIAKFLGIAVSAVHMRLSRARQRLAERLSAQGVESGS